eukprot:5317431-Alexandrium_andersonii.AAC.1
MRVILSRVGILGQFTPPPVGVASLEVREKCLCTVPRALGQAAEPLSFFLPSAGPRSPCWVNEASALGAAPPPSA